jgi:proteasome lid subunit RPN8/RPN11
MRASIKLANGHSHPNFEPVPSSRDDNSMREIIQDSKLGANFVVLLIAYSDESRQRFRGKTDSNSDVKQTVVGA